MKPYKYDVVIIGTSHTLQISSYSESNTISLQLQDVLITQCKAFCVRLIAEEMNEQYLGMRGKSTTVGKQVAGRIGLGHSFCEPTLEERKKMGINSFQDIQLTGIIDRLSKNEIHRKLRESFALREKYWLKVLRSIDIWPVLLLCGAMHVRSMEKRINLTELSCFVAFDDWAPNK